MRETEPSRRPRLIPRHSVVNCEDQVTDDKSGQTSSRLPRIPRVEKQFQIGQPLYPPKALSTSSELFRHESRIPTPKKIPSKRSSRQNMNALVTGATGFLGNNLVRALIDHKDSVRVIVREGSDTAPLRGLNVQKFTGSLENEAMLREAAAGVDVIYHCAGYVKIGWSQLKKARRINVDLTQKIIKIAQEYGARLVHVSTVNTLGVGQNGLELDERSAKQNYVSCSYVISKKEAEQAVQQAVGDGLDAVIIHPSFMLGPYDWKPSSGSMMLEVLTVRPPLAPRGGCSVADVRDVAKAMVAAGHKGLCGENYILSGHRIRYYDLWVRFANLKERRGPYTTVGPRLGGAIGRVADLWATVTGQESNFNSALVQMGAQTHYYRSDKARKYLGYENRPLDVTIQETWNWFCENGFAKA